MDIHILTLFPGMFAGPFAESIVSRAVQNGVVSIHLHDIRDFSRDKHRTVDDSPFGGGGGMVLKPEPLFEAVEAIKAAIGEKHGMQRSADAHVALLSPQGRVLTQDVVKDLTGYADIILICGHYEGVDERVIERVVDAEISIGDYVLSGGEIPAMVLTDALVRLLPGAVGDTDSIQDDSHSTGLLQFPQYTRPATYRGLEVPPVLLSGNHPEVDRWRRRESLLRTQKRRPDLLDKTTLDEADRTWLEQSERGPSDEQPPDADR